jgi:hypothetical protein
MWNGVVVDETESGASDSAATLMLAALTAFSNACQHPTLSIECPFSVPVRPGIRTCNEECVTILEANGVSLNLSEPFPITASLQRHPRVTVGGDLRERYLREAGMRVRRWSLTSLVTHLSETLLAGPITAEKEALHLQVVDELTRRGVSVGDLVRLGVGVRLGQMLALSVVLPPLWPADEVEEPCPVPTATEGWLTIFDTFMVSRGMSADQMDDPQIRFNKAMSENFAAFAIAWASEARLADIFSWRAPPPSALPRIEARSRDHSDVEDIEIQIWLLERWTQSYYDDWSSKSLRLEYRWALGEAAAPCNDALMRARTIDEVELTKTIAVDAVMSPAAPESAFQNLKRWAFELLQSGRRSDAATVLDGARRLSWELPEPHNDYGFCILPSDPSGALEALEESMRLGYQRTINLCNRMLALHLIGKNEAALQLAETVANNFHPADEPHAALWDPISVRDEDPQLQRNVQPKEYAIKLAVLISQEEGGETATLWAERSVTLLGSVTDSPSPGG